MSNIYNIGDCFKFTCGTIAKIVGVDVDKEKYELVALKKAYTLNDDTNIMAFASLHEGTYQENGIEQLDGELTELLFG